MDLSLPSDLEQFVERQIALGVYETPSDVVGDALRLLQFHERERQALIDDTRQKIAAGIEQLDRGESISAGEVFRGLRERIAASRSSSAS